MKGHSVYGTRSQLVQSKNKPEACIAQIYQLISTNYFSSTATGLHCLLKQTVSSGSKGTLQENPSLMTISELDTVTKFLSYLQSGYSLEKCKLII